MSVIQEKAASIASSLRDENVEEKIAFDPMTILVIIQVIGAIVKMWQDCRATPAQAAASSRDLNVLERLRLRRAIRHCVRDEDFNRAVGTQLFNAIKNAGTAVTEEEIQAMYDEAVHLDSLSADGDIAHPDVKDALGKLEAR